MQPDTQKRNDDLVRFRLPTELKDHLREAAKMHGRNMSELLREIVTTQAGNAKTQ